MPDKFVIPDFASEAEEAQWWFDHREELASAFHEAASQGRLHLGSVGRKARERAAAGNAPAATTIPVDQDISRARQSAARSGLPYEAYLKMLAHRALDSEEQKLAG